MGIIMRNGISYGGFDKDIYTVSELPEIGEKDKLYIIEDTKSLYYWDGVKFENLIQSSSIDSNIDAKEKQILIGNNENWAEGTNWYTVNQFIIKPTDFPTWHYSSWDIYSIGVDFNQNHNGRSLIEIGKLTKTDDLNSNGDPSLKTDFLSSPILRIGDTATVTALNNSSIFIDADSQLKIGNNKRPTGYSSKLEVTDGAVVIIEGNGKHAYGIERTESPDVIIKNGVHIHIDNGNGTNTEVNPDFNAKKYIDPHNSAVIIHDNSIVDLSDSFYLKGSGKSTAAFEGESKLFMKDNTRIDLSGGGGLIMHGTYNKEEEEGEKRQPIFCMEDGARISMSGNKKGDPLISLKGGGGIILNNGAEQDNTDMGSFLVLEPKDFILSCGMETFSSFTGDINNLSEPLNQEIGQSKINYTQPFNEFKIKEFDLEESLIAELLKPDCIIDQERYEEIVKKVFLNIKKEYQIPTVSRGSQYYFNDSQVNNFSMALMNNNNWNSWTVEKLKNEEFLIPFYIVKEEKYEDWIKIVGIERFYISDYTDGATYSYYIDKINGSKMTINDLCDTYWIVGNKYISQGNGANGFFTIYENYCKQNNLEQFSYYYKVEITDKVMDAAEVLGIDPYSYFDYVTVDNKKHIINPTVEQINELNNKLKTIDKNNINTYFIPYQLENEEIGYKVSNITRDELKLVLDKYNYPITKVSGRTTIDIGNNEAGTYFWFKGGGNEPGDYTKVLMMDNTHTEMRQNSIFSLRGNCQKDYQWNDYPYNPVTNGSMLTMYDNARFVMRGKWDDGKGIYYSKKEIQFNGDELTPCTSVEDLSEISRKNLDNVLRKENKVYVTGSEYEVITSSINDDGTLSYKLSNFNYKVIDFNAYMQKEENNPLMELIENSEFRMEGDGVLKINSNGISINGIEFTNEQLNALKNLLN